MSALLDTGSLIVAIICREETSAGRTEDRPSALQTSSRTPLAVRSRPSRGRECPATAPPADLAPPLVGGELASRGASTFAGPAGGRPFITTNPTYT